MTCLYGKVAFVEALFHVGRSSLEIQRALTDLMVLVRSPLSLTTGFLHLYFHMPYDGI